MDPVQADCKPYGNITPLIMLPKCLNINVQVFELTK